MYHYYHVPVYHPYVYHPMYLGFYNPIGLVITAIIVVLILSLVLRVVGIAFSASTASLCAILAIVCLFIGHIGLAIIFGIVALLSGGHRRW